MTRSQMASIDYRKPVLARPRKTEPGDVVYLMPQSMNEENHEIALVSRFVCDRKLFGQGYASLMHEYFWAMPPNSGVYIRPFVTITEILPKAKFPGDIDLLIIPFEGNKLVLSKTLVVETKALRASFKRQGKSPNQYGFSQASALLDHGFPYVAVAHIIVSDESPHEAWEERLAFQVIDQSGKCRELGSNRIDTMPEHLIRRSYGRLQANSPRAEIGLLATYLADGSTHTPEGREAAFNASVSVRVLDAIANYYHQNVKTFLETKRN